MKNIGTIFRFTFREQARKKSYLIVTVLLMLVAAGLVALPTIVTRLQSGKTAQNGQTAPSSGVFYLYDDTSAAIDPAALQKALPDYAVKTVSADRLDTVKQAVLTGKSGKDDVLAVFRQTGSSSAPAPSFSYYTKSRNSGPDPDKLAEIFRTIRAEYLLHRSGVTSVTAADLLRPVTYSTQAGDHSDNMAGFVPAIAVCILLFIAIFTYGIWVATSIAAEKSSRVLEILITSTKPSGIVIGKSLAMGTLGLIQLLLVLGSGAVSYMAVGGGGQLAVFSFAGFTPGAFLLLFVYFVLGFSLYAMLSAVAGASVSNAEDLRSAMQPITILGVVSFYLSYGSFMAPGTPLSLVASLIPFSAPFAMPARLMMAGVPWWQVVLSLLLLAGTTWGMGALSIRLYTSALLHYGKQLKIRDLFRMAGRSN